MKTLILFCLFAVSGVYSQQNLKLPAIFSDNMVLQQNSLVTFWGLAEPGAKVEVVTDWSEPVSTYSDQNSEWKVKIRTPESSGPFNIQISASNKTIRIQNVLIGEVWLCSGQSNMEMPLAGWPPNDIILNSESEIANADYPEIRLFTVARSNSFEPKTDVSGSWSECSPSTAKTFSATAYFFAKKLYKELNIPIGLIHSSWGGTPAESWTSKEYLSQLPEFIPVLDKIERSRPKFELFNEWLGSFPKLDISKKTGENIWADLNFQDDDCRLIDYDDSDWKDMELPQQFEESEIGVFDGAVWFRKKIEVPKTWAGKDLQLELGPIDDMDITYVNEIRVGGYEMDGFWQTDRIYTVPADVLRNNVINIAVRVVDTQGGGGFHGKPEQMKLMLKETGETLSISGDWKYLPVAEFKSMNFYVFGEKGKEFNKRPSLEISLTSHTPTTLFNAMISPLIPFEIKGAIWYQGESNAGNPLQYEKLFPLMIKNWRAVWGNEFPFYFVQIAPYDYGESTQSQFLRDAQRKTMKLDKTGMAVTLDIGNYHNIHPANKIDVGTRLALWALAHQYDKPVVFSGPMYKSMNVENNKIILAFDYVEEGLDLRLKRETQVLK